MGKKFLNHKQLYTLLTVATFIISFTSCKKKLEEELANATCTVRGNYVHGCGALSLTGALTTVATGFNGAYGVTTDGTYLYVNDTGNVAVKKVEIATGNTTTLVNSGVANLNAITFDGTDLFTESNVTLIKKIEIATGTVSTLTASASPPYDLTADAANIYAVTGSTLKQVEISTGTVTTLASSGSLTFDSLTYDGTYFYAGHNGGMFGSPSIKKIEKSTGTITDFATAGLSSVSGMTTDGVYLYVLDSSTLKKYDLATGSVTTLVASGLAGPQAITTDGRFLYIIDGSTLYKVE